MSSSIEEFKVTREIQATLIPNGQPTIILEGATVRIVQALGGSYTVITSEGYMARIEGKDGDAIGQKKIEAPDLSNMTIDDQIWAQMKTCYDPEIPVNIVDLGLIYDCQISDFKDGGHRVEVKMTLTAPGCGMGDVLRNEVKQKLMALTDVKDAAVELVWEPAWDKDRMSEAAKLKLGFM